MLWVKKAQAMDASVAPSTAGGYFSCLTNFWSWLDTILPEADRAALPADVREHRRITAALGERFMLWLNTQGAPATQFKKYHNALCWAQQVCACMAQCAPHTVHASRCLTLDALRALPHGAGAARAARTARRAARSA